MSIVNKLTILADLSLIFIAIIRGSSFVVIKDILNTMSPFYVLSCRFCVAAFILMIVFRKHIKLIDTDHIKAGFMISVFLFMAFATQTIGLKYTLAGKQAFLTSLYVAIIPFAICLQSKKRPDLNIVLPALLAVIGVGFLTINKEVSFNMGDFLSILSAFFFAGHIIAISIFSKNKDIFIIVILQMFFTGIFSLFFAVSFEVMPYYKDIINVKWSLSYLVFICTMLNFFIQNVAQKYSPSHHVGILLCLESVFGGILSTLILNETFTSNMLVGCVIIFFSIIFIELRPFFLSKIKNNYISDKELKNS